MSFYNDILKVQLNFAVHASPVRGGCDGTERARDQVENLQRGVSEAAGCIECGPAYFGAQGGRAWNEIFARLRREVLGDITPDEFPKSLCVRWAKVYENALIFGVPLEVSRRVSVKELLNAYEHVKTVYKEDPNSAGDDGESPGGTVLEGLPMTRLLAKALVLGLGGSLKAAPPQTPEGGAALRQKAAPVVVTKVAKKSAGEEETGAFRPHRHGPGQAAAAQARYDQQIEYLKADSMKYPRETPTVRVIGRPNCPDRRQHRSV